MRRLIALWVWLGAVLAPLPALAHATLIAAEPSDRAVVATSPAAVVLRFNEPVQPVFARVLDGQGRLIVQALPVAATPELRLPLAAPLIAGQYLVSYRVISADAHPVSGTILFAIGVAPGEWAPPEVDERAGGAWTAIEAANRALHFLALSLAAGAAVFLLLAREHPALRAAVRPIVAVGCVLGAATALAAIPIQGGVVLGGEANVFSAELWRAAGATTQTRASIAAALLLAFLWRLAERPRAAFVLALGALTTPALTGHVVTAGSPWLTVPVLLGHAMPGFLWIGSLAPLLLALHNPAAAADMLARFARAAAPLLALLFAAGFAIAALQVRSWEGLVHTAYGNTLVLKSVLVAALLALAAVNRWNLTPRLLRGDTSTATALRQSIAAELVLGAAVLAVTAVLAHTPPPRSLTTPAAAADAHAGHEAEAGGYAIAAVAQGKTAVIAVTPARAGQNTLTIALRGAGWSGVEPLAVTVAIANAAAGVEPIVRELPRIGTGLYELKGPELAFPGEWSVRVDVLISDFEKISYAATLPVQ